MSVELHPSAVVSARLLLGAVLRRGDVAVAITEVEAYEGVDDPASHAFRGPTPRNQVMFGPPGRLYVYTMHGHFCANIVCSPEGRANAVLVRAGRVVDGVEHARTRRPGVPDHRLARGPGCLTRALGITLADAGTDLFDDRSAVRLAPRSEEPRIIAGPRVGVSRAAEVTWRFWVPDDPTVSAYRPAKRAAGPGHGVAAAAGASTSTARDQGRT